MFALRFKIASRDAACQRQSRASRPHSVNCNTTYFAAEYVCKRLHFLGDRHLSQLMSWSSWHCAWHKVWLLQDLTFLNEFLVMLMEKDLESMLLSIPKEFYHKM
ncbi:hypothetical protein PYW07_000388 [Mythimna separata]|uniref:Uncharacterized protein n=1 Tax=Mythimna separata TaxID=271217 RepID=A0AAD7Z227_MYTSE|nr:hypothetical protein PYW07_000388 [Mythimna separata]